MTLDLHQRTLQQGLASRFVCGYSKSGKESVNRQNYPQVTKRTPRMTAMASIVLFRPFNRNLFGNFNKLYRTIAYTAGPVILHPHVLHNYWLNLKSVVRFCEKVKNHKPDITLVWTLRDHWSVTGCCVFIGGCEDWKTGCQKRPTLDNYPPVKIDCARQLAAGKRQLFREMLALDCQLISPSQYVADALDSLHGPGRCRIIDNGIDMAIEVILVDSPPVRETQDRPKIAAVAHDLRYNGRTNQQLVRGVMALSDKVELHIFGKFSPLTAGGVVNHGFETDKHKLMSALSQMNVLVLSSCIDSYPLILRETLSTGVPVIATHSDAAQEVLQRSGGKTVSEEEVLQPVQLNKPKIAQAIFGITLAELSQRNRAAYSG